MGPQLVAATATILETTTTTVLEEEEPNGLEDVARAVTAATTGDDEERKEEKEVEEERASSVSSDSNPGGAGEDGRGRPADVGEADEEKEEEDNDDEDGEKTTASSLRARGKDLHDAGNYVEAADLFRRASRRLLADEEAKAGGGEAPEEEYATCRLHEALCRLKAGGPLQAEGAVEACGSVLDRRDGLPNVLVARAYHRRAKAYLALGRPDDALTDARSAAFLGDRKAVALYGKLMREHPSSGELGGGTSQGGLMTDSSSLLDVLMNAGSSNGGGPTFPSALDHLTPGGLPFLPSLADLGGGHGSDGGSLAQSVLSSLSKKLHDEATQDSICRFLQQTSPLQIRSFAGVAGVPIAERQADQLASFCRGITPGRLRGWIRTGHRVAYGVRLMRKLSKVVSKYRTLLIVLCLLAWTKSAILRPIPLSKAVKRAQSALLQR